MALEGVRYSVRPDRSTFRETGDTDIDSDNFIGTHEEIGSENSDFEWRALVREFNYNDDFEEMEIWTFAYEDGEYLGTFNVNIDVAPFTDEGLSIVSLCRAHHHAYTFIGGELGDVRENYHSEQAVIDENFEHLELSRAGSTHDLHEDE